MDKLFQIQKCLSEEAIKKYLTNSLSDEDRFQVEDHLLDCPFCTDAAEGLEAHYDFEKNDSLDRLDTHFEKELKKEEVLVKTLKPRSRFSINQIAAAILLLLVPVAAWMYWNSNPDQKLYADFLPENTSLSTTVRSGEMQELEIPVRQAKKLFEEKRYDAALEASQRVLENTPEQPLAIYYAGLSAMESGHAELARHYFSTLRINEAAFYEDATWYMILNEVKAGDKFAAKKLLEELMQLPQGLYFDKANDLMERL